MYRVIIADDEEIIRNGVVQLIDWAKLECVVVRECASGSEVLTYLEDHEADILITDVKMPEIDGIRLLEKIHEKNLNISVVLLTAYSDFSSAQSAIRYGAVDYVVKNDFIEDLPRAIGLAKEEAERRKRENQKPEGFNEADVAGYILETLALSKMLSRSSDIAKYGLNRYDYCVCSCEILDFAHAPVTDKNVQMLKNFMNTIVNRHKYYIVNIRPDSLTLIICEEKDAGLCAEEIAVMCNEILRIVDEFMRVNLKFGVSTVVRDVEQLGAAYNESVQALARCASRGNEVIFYVEESGMGITEDINSYIPKITDCLFQKDLLEAERHLEEMKEVVAQGGVPF